MRFLHTADWHVGKTLQGRSRAEEHEAVLAEIVDVARREEVELSIVAGDLFDTAAPSPESERIVFSALLELGRVAPVVVFPGNHDNERRLAALMPVFERAEVSIVPSVKPECMKLEIGGENVRLGVIPWLSQRYIVKASQLMAHDAGDLAQHYDGRMKNIVAALASGFDGESVNIFAAHMTIAGSELGGGERTAQTIFDYYVAPNVFPSNCHYVALGHIHKMQAMPAPCPMHYCGAPLHLDFSDSTDAKNVLVVDASPGAPASVRPIELAAGRRLRTIKGPLATLAGLTDTVGDDYLRVIVEERARIGLSDEIREMFPNAVKVIVDRGDEGRTEHVADRAGLSPDELFTRYLAERDTEDPALVALFNELYTESVDRGAGREAEDHAPASA
ncbi:MAG TPA: exonuclease SbcCD subunit D [Actinomycetota bacterium]|nr:exonuclease SbcCD subunit D [Actinomycetota bacterium]